MFLAALAGCASPELKATRDDIDMLAKKIDGPVPAPAAGATLSPEALVATASERGQDVMKAEIKRAEAELALDETKSRRLPRISAEARDYVTFQRQGGVASDANVILGVNWDIAYALLGLDKHNVEIAEKLIPVQYQIARRNALSGLLSSYASLSDLDFQRRRTLLEADKLSCQQTVMRAESQLGNVSEAELKALGQKIVAVRREVGAITAAMKAQEAKVLSLAGLGDAGYRIRPAASVLPALSALPQAADTDGDACFERSGNKILENLLVEAAGAQLDLARKSRFTKLTAALPTFMSQNGGLSFQFLVGYVLPLIDQGDAMRVTQRARLNLLNTILVAKENRQGFLNRYNDMALNAAGLAREQAQAQLAVETARTALASAPEAGRCEAEVVVRQARLAREEALFKLDLARAGRRLLCAPLDDEAGAEPVLAEAER
ncbi:hypothetical protein [Martelella radicis]|uniref:TolC family protein n=1 Tax=Martelella radicis TaxID=1397476 RepID=A0A7W6KFG3_9HYPH|nr:hypothetical protein [Martelella radicis]MBB4120291.1 hypothetical protein [Martelella radicis]